LKAEKKATKTPTDDLVSVTAESTAQPQQVEASVATGAKAVSTGVWKF